MREVLAGVAGQRLPDGSRPELVVCDSGSGDGSAEMARSFGAKVIAIPAGEFSHGGTRNLLMEGTSGSHVAFLTQDAVPADELWLARLLEGFSAAEDVGLVFGPYLPRADASPMVARELQDWFKAFAPDGARRVDRLSPAERATPVRELLGPRGFFTDANGCISREAWRRVPFRDVPYAEDHVLAHDMLRAGYAKVFLPDAAVVHSHEYPGWGWLRRSFDESRALAEIYGYRGPGSASEAVLRVRGLVGADWRWWRSLPGEDRGRRGSGLVLLVRSTRHHALRTAGAVLGGRAARIPPALARRLSLERRG